MANLHVQPKKRNYVWVWILIILIIAAGIYYYINYYKKGINPFSNTALREAPAVQEYTHPVAVIAMDDFV